MDAKKIDELRNDERFRRTVNNSGWYLNPDDALADIHFYLSYIMAESPRGVGPFKSVKEKFGLTNDDFIDALRNSPPGLFLYEVNWNECCEILGLDSPIPYPRKHPDAVLF